MGKPLFEFFDVWSSQAAQFLSQLPMSPRLVEAARRSVGIMGSVAVRDRLCPLGRHFRELVQEFLPLFECRLSLEQLRESFPSLVVSVIVDVFERLLKSLQQWARDFRRLQRPNRLEPSFPHTFEPLDFDSLDLFVRKWNQLIPNEMHDPGCFGFLVGLKW